MENKKEILDKAINYLEDWLMKNKKKYWIFFGRFGNKPWDSDYFGSQSICEQTKMTETEAHILAQAIIKQNSEINFEEDEEIFQYKIEEWLPIDEEDKGKKWEFLK